MKGIAKAETTRHDVIEPNSLAAASTPAAKQRIRDNTDAAIASGIFGVPTILIDGELFWGNDDWPYLKRYVAEEAHAGRLVSSLDQVCHAKWRPGLPIAIARLFRMRS